MLGGAAARRSRDSVPRRIGGHFGWRFGGTASRWLGGRGSFARALHFTTGAPATRATPKPNCKIVRPVFFRAEEFLDMGMDQPAITVFPYAAMIRRIEQ